MSDERGKVVEERRPRHRFDQYLAHRRYQPTLSLTPDGSEIAYLTNTSGQFNLWRQSTDGGYAHQLTTFDDRTVREVAWAPDGETILFTADLDGDEFHQIYRLPAVGGGPRRSPMPRRFSTSSARTRGHRMDGRSSTPAAIGSRPTRTSSCATSMGAMRGDRWPATRSSFPGSGRRTAPL